ncbi:hypothetical protein CANARDRAFT_29825 [[Candida] arabinofermentans NRRL YB-2248]|uniref:MRH domain-containing protein n=1 Tax=[Candida] arabinofermentans NRRL YB-2248 TaxID=983967 RepID=A0A1E4SVQ7_9ASCO|nr:hypothetical protein CANARDRAFT_29825 [[Candida] arabinofermentans NRRL YB-2248]
MPTLRRSVIWLTILIVVICITTIASSQNNVIRTEIKEEAIYLKEQWDHLDQFKSKQVDGDNNTSDDDDNGGSLDPIIEPCTVINPLTNQFFDLRSLGSLGPDSLTQAWNARGFDYGRNFSLGICSTPLKQLSHISNKDFQDIDNKTEVGGYFTDEFGNKQSIGQWSTIPKFRGRKMVLEYNDGSYCKNTIGGEKLRKSTILSFTCDREIMSKAQVSFIGSLHDCSYFFEVRTIHACPTAAKEDDSALIYIFLFICLCALAVYMGAGFVYKFFKRLQLHQSSSSWKQQQQQTNRSYIGEQQQVSKA